ncbi:MAG: prepilin-type N-terminal cleavage/methylation domain-containing protein [Burkholderiales bacterium]|nr:prepilin-type N-terminal cleavage/methylation domain-containing protein [Burkholderiales bacterium]
MKKNFGFTLIELMVVVVIIGILAAIAFPNYTAYVVRGKVAEATSGLADYRVKLEQYYQDNRNYGVAAASPCGTAGPPVVPALPTGQYFTFTCTVGATDQTYTATATNKVNVGLGAVGGYTFTVDTVNAKTTGNFAGAAENKACWISRSGQTC